MLNACWLWLRSWCSERERNSRPCPAATPLRRLRLVLSRAILKLRPSGGRDTGSQTLTEVKQVMSLSGGNTMKAALTDLWKSEHRVS